MNEGRIDPDDPGEAFEFDPDDPRVRDVESRPRVRARLRAYRDFMAPGELPGNARVAEAEAALRTVLEREIGTPLVGDEASGPSGERIGSAPPVGRGPRPAGSGPRGWFRAMLPGGMRNAFAVAALIVVAGAAWLVIDARRDDRAPVMRGDDPAMSEEALATKPVPEVLADGLVRLEWAPSPEADGYAVVFLSADLEEIARVPGLEQTHLDLVPGAAPAGLQSGRQVLWRAVAMRGSDEVARSRARPITVP